MFRQSHPKKKDIRQSSPGSDDQRDLDSLSKQPLSRAVISYTGLSIKERELVNKKIRAMGGKVNVDLTEDITHLLASKVGSDKYRVAFGLRIPVLDPAWLEHIHDRWANGQNVDIQKAVEEFSLGPLKGCSICVTGFPADQRLAIQRDTIQYGGKYTSDLLKSVTTHLICDHPSGEKYTSALQWGIKCVPRQWLRDTMSTLGLAKSTRSKDSAEMRKRSNQEDEKEDEKPLVAPDQMYLEACQIYLCKSFPAAQATRLKKMIRIAGGIHITDYDSLEVTHVLVPSNKLESSTITLFNHDGDLPYIVNQQWLRLSHRESKALPETDFVVPFPTRTDDGQPKPVRFEGATTWTTDPIMGSRDTGGKLAVKPSNKATVRSKSRAPDASDVVPNAGNRGGSQIDRITFQGYRDNESPTSPPSDKTPVSPPSNQSPRAARGVHPRTASGILSEALGDLSMNSTQQLQQTQDSSLTVRADEMRLDEEEEEDEALSSNIFLGLYITSHGCKKEVAKTIRKQTIACGGTYIDETETLPAEAHLKTIVPLSMPWDKVKDLKGAVLTSCWFERSIIEGKVISRKDHFLYKPMKAIPIEGFQDLSISLSSMAMKEVEYTQIGRAIKILGATFYDRLHTTNTNLLISDYPTGPKYEFMAKSGRPVVRMDWLRLCIEEGKATQDAKRDLRAAKRDGLYIVSPTWLYKCKETRLRANEREHPEAYDDKHLTLTTTHTTHERPTLAVLPKRASSPSLRAPGRVGTGGRKRTPSVGFGRSATAGYQPHRQGSGQPSPTLTFQGTAAGVMSAIFGPDSTSTSVVISSANTTMDMSYASMADIHALQHEEGGHSDNFGIWQPVPLIPVARNATGRKRRRAAAAVEGVSLSATDMDTSATCETPDESNDGSSIPENYFDTSAEPYGENAVYWVDVEGREKKRALLESLGFKTVKPVISESSLEDGRLGALARDMESQRGQSYNFLLTGISIADRALFKKTIAQLGGTVLEDKSDDQEEWQQRCTHLITNGNNPPRTAKLVVAKACKAVIVNKGFMFASAEQGAFVDDGPYRVHV
ncbi:DNA topoisomerase 2-binding protein 1 [Dissophora ornata]|nr:DNA topoisomerase 2-binding protein 1 [Dissophora ornata]